MAHKKKETAQNFWHTSFMFGVAVGIIVAGAGLSALVLTPATPTDLMPATPPAEVAVLARQLDDRRPASLTVETAPDSEIRAAQAGMITQLECAPGVTLVSGQPAIYLDGEPIMGLASALPLWRELRAGDSGADVSALRAELARLELGISPGNRIDLPTIRAVGRLLSDSGAVSAGKMVQAEQTIIPSAFLWLKSPRVALSKCLALPGYTIAEGEPIFETQGQALNARVTISDADVLPGSRQFSAGDVHLTVPEDNLIRDADTLLAISETETYRNSLGAERRGVISGAVTLLSPVDGFSVPASALFSSVGPDPVETDEQLGGGSEEIGEVDGDSLKNQRTSPGLQRPSCIFGDGQPLRVHVMGSQLGQTFVRIEAETPPNRVLVRPPAGSSCPR